MNITRARRVRTERRDERTRFRSVRCVRAVRYVVIVRLPFRNRFRTSGQVRIKRPRAYIPSVGVLTGGGGGAF